MKWHMYNVESHLPCLSRLDGYDIRIISHNYDRQGKPSTPLWCVYQEHQILHHEDFISLEKAQSFAERYVQQDLAIRRVFKWGLVSGTLTTLFYHRGLCCWMMKYPGIPTFDNAWAFYSEQVATPVGTDGIEGLHRGLTRAEAQQVIYDMVTYARMG